MKVTEKGNIKNVLDNTSSKDDASDVFNWFVSSIEGRSHLSDLIDKDSYLLEEKIDEDLLITTEQSQRILSKIEKDIKLQVSKRLFIKVAAVLIPFILFVSLGFYLNNQVDLFGKATYSEIYVPKGENIRILFHDGSEAYLNSDTKLRYPNKFGVKNRKVFLRGEAYFNVTANKQRPFIVSAENSDIVVLGTSFNVNAYENEKTIEVVLDEGEVVFKALRNEYEIVPGQKIEYDKALGTIKISNLKRSDEASLWKNNVIHFSNTTLSEVLMTLSRRYDIEFIISNPSVLKYTFTLTTKQTTVENILFELGKIAPVKFHLNNNQVSVDL